MGSKLFWSSLFGIVIIVLLAATLYVRSIAPSISAPSTPAATTTSTTPTPKPAAALILSAPADDAYTTSSTTRVSGKSRPGSTVVITGGRKDHVFEADQSGTFSSEVTLVEGTNELTITAVSEDGTQSTVQRTIIYESEETQ